MKLFSGIINQEIGTLTCVLKKYPSVVCKNTSRYFLSSRDKNSLPPIGDIELSFNYIFCVIYVG